MNITEMQFAKREIEYANIQLDAYELATVLDALARTKHDKAVSLKMRIRCEELHKELASVINTIIDFENERRQEEIEESMRELKKAVENENQ